ncbi:MAG: hypothetical protein AAB654_20580 [Acidobacteriota bacterium]
MSNLASHFSFAPMLWYNASQFAGSPSMSGLSIDYILKRAVAEIISERFPATLQLSAAAFLLTICVSVLLGVVTAVRRAPVASLIRFRFAPTTTASV